MDILGLIALARSKGSGSGSGTFVPSFGTLATIQTGVSWFGDDPYTLTVLVSGYTVTDKTMISVLPSANVIEQMIADGVTNIFITNNNGTLTATAVGGAPTAAMTLQVLCSESDASAELGNLPNIVGDGVLETLQATDLTDAINQLSSDLDDAKNAIEQKQDAPSSAGTSGQVLGLDSNLDPVWVNQKAPLSDATISALLACFRNVAWANNNGSSYYADLLEALTDYYGYVSDGLIALWDGINNTGTGHDASATAWTDLIGGHQFVQLETPSTVSFGTNCVNFDPSTVGSTTADNKNVLVCPHFGLAKTVEVVLNCPWNTPMQIGWFTGQNGLTKDEQNLIAYSKTQQAICVKNDVLDGNYSVDSIYNVNSVSTTYGTTCICYINGSQASQKGATNSFSGPPGIVYNRLMIGGSPSYSFKGKIYSVRLYNRVLTAAEIAANHAVDVARFELGS